MKKINVGIIGLGTIGTGVYKILKERKSKIKKLYNIDINIKKTCDISESRKKNLKIPSKDFTKDYRDITRDEDINIVVELIGGTTLAYSICKDAIKNGKHIVTANKALLASKNKELQKLSDQNKVNIGYEASVGGGIPIINSIKDSLLINRVTSFWGILNGTCNYILTLMSKGIDFSKALKMAQNEGFAEADPTLDINGKDTAHKVSVLSQTCFNINLDIEKIFTQGIERITSYDIDVANNLGYEIKLLGISRIINSKLDARVHPTLISKDNPLSNVKNEFNAILVNSDNLGPFMAYGYGAGMMPTASAIVSDIVRISDSYKIEYLQSELKIKLNKFEDIKSKFYLRISIKDEPGNLGKVTSILGKYKINIDKVIQNNEGSKSKIMPVILLTKSLELKMLNKAINVISRNKLIRGEPLIIPVEDLA
ncbi:homoserine dehydrogenase [bacterium]|nr:homoserine dehydrogenase [bacterium]|tara:strand:- start:6629 stop:7906 length:1278 start_codon:yes stop_codon:yes gene_type:complete